MLFPQGVQALRPQTVEPTCSLEVESHHVTAHRPQWVGVIVGGFHALSFRVDSTQSFAVVLQEVPGAALSWYLVLHEGADLFVGVLLCR